MICTLLQNRYRLDAELGTGGMGTVYRAHDMLLDRDVAVKVLTNASLGTEGRARLLREAHALIADPSRRIAYDLALHYPPPPATAAPEGERETFECQECGETKVIYELTSVSQITNHIEA